MSLIDTTNLGLRDQAGFLSASTSTPGSYSQIYAFGDSLSDAGNIYTATAHLLPASPYDDGHFSNGPTWVEDLANDLGLPALTPSLLGGTDFAFGGAETGQEALHNRNILDLPSQLAQFVSAAPSPAPGALYTLSIGANDVLDSIGAYAANPSGAIANIGQAVANETSFIAALAADGARNVLVMNVPDLGKAPGETSQGGAVAMTATRLSALYDSELNAALGALAAQSGITIQVMNAFGLLDLAVSHPAAFGLTNVTDPVWTGTYGNPNSGQLNAVGAAQNGYLFFDQLHPTETGHLALAGLAQHALAGPALA